MLEIHNIGLRVYQPINNYEVSHYAVISHVNRYVSECEDTSLVGTSLLVQILSSAALIL